MQTAKSNYERNKIKMTEKEFRNTEKKVRRAAAKEGYTIRRRTIPGYGIGYDIVDANNVIRTSGNFDMSLNDVAEWFNVQI